ncbi:hypothetical protein D3C87_1804330 [compost metagenome]
MVKPGLGKLVSHDGFVCLFQLQRIMFVPVILINKYQYFQHVYSLLKHAEAEPALMGESESLSLSQSLKLTVGEMTDHTF